MAEHCALCGHELPDAPQLSLAGPMPEKKVRRGDPSTSRRAASLAAPRAGTQKARLFDAFIASREGLTAYEASERTGLAYVSVSTRCSELERAGVLVRTGRTRLTANGGEADVLAVTDAARERLAGVAA